MRLGIHGRAGTGKSTAAQILRRRLGFTVIDLDAVGHMVLQMPAVRSALRHHFGDDIFTPTGDIHRKALGERVFQNANDLAILNRLVHPFIYNTVTAQLATLSGPVLIVGALIEQIGLRPHIDFLIHIDATDATLDRHTPEKAAIRAVQRSREAYATCSDVTLQNDFTSDFEALLIKTIGTIGDVA